MAEQPSRRKRDRLDSTEARLSEVITELELRLMQIERQHYALKGRELALREIVDQQSKRFQNITERSPLPGEHITLSTVDSLTAAEVLINVKMKELELVGQPESLPGSSNGSNPEDVTFSGQQPAEAGDRVTYVDTILSHLQTPQQLQRFRTITREEYRKVYNRFAEMASILLGNPEFNTDSNSMLLEQLLDETLVSFIPFCILYASLRPTPSSTSIRSGS
jgi:hypothetical protein